MKILLSTYYNARFAALNEYVETTLRRMGHEIVVFEHYRYRLPGRVRNRLSVLQSWEVGRLNHSLRQRTERERPDLLLVLAGITIAPDTIRSIRRSGVTAVNWFADYPAHFDYTMQAAPAYDWFFVSDSLSRDRHRAAGHANVHWLPFGCLPAWADGPLTEPDDTGAATDIDAVFIGSWYPERAAWLSGLSGCRLAVWGPGWRKRAEGPLRGAVRGDAVGPAEWRGLYRRTPVSLNLHYGFGGEPIPYGAMANTKVFEVLATGGFLLTDEKKDLTTLLAPGRDFVGFHDDQDCAAKLRYYLYHAEERRVIARRGQQNVLANHTYAHRLGTMLTMIERGA
jgi:spore maturation protein CgeB